MAVLWRRGNRDGFREPDQRGQSAVEMALVLPVLLLVLFGITEFGRLLGAYVTVQNAAREGARLGITGADDQAIEAKVRDVARYLEGAGDAGRLAVSVSPSRQADRRPGTDLEVRVSYRFQLLVPMIGNLFPPSMVQDGRYLMLAAAMKMRI